MCIYALYRNYVCDDSDDDSDEEVNYGETHSCRRITLICLVCDREDVSDDHRCEMEPETMFNLKRHARSAFRNITEEGDMRGTISPETFFKRTIYFMQCFLHYLENNIITE